MYCIVTLCKYQRKKSVINCLIDKSKSVLIELKKIELKRIQKTETEDYYSNVLNPVRFFIVIGVDFHNQHRHEVT